MENIICESQDLCPAEREATSKLGRIIRDLIRRCVYLVIGAGKPCAAHASARDSPSTPRYLLRPSPVAFGAVRPEGSEINKLPKVRASRLFVTFEFFTFQYKFFIFISRNRRAMHESERLRA